MSDFFTAGGVGMYPTLVFGFLAIASAALFVIRREPRQASLARHLAAATFGTGLLNFCLGLMNTFRYLEHVPAAEQFHIAALGAEESVHNLVLSLTLTVLVALLLSIGVFRTRTLNA